MARVQGIYGSFTVSHYHSVPRNDIDLSSGTRWVQIKQVFIICDVVKFSLREWRSRWFNPIDYEEGETRKVELKGARGWLDVLNAGQTIDWEKEGRKGGGHVSLYYVVAQAKVEEREIWKEDGRPGGLDRDHCSDNTGPVWVETAKREEERILDTDFLKECNFGRLLLQLVGE